MRAVFPALLFALAAPALAASETGRYWVRLVEPGAIETLARQHPDPTDLRAALKSAAGARLVDRVAVSQQRLLDAAAPALGRGVAAVRRVRLVDNALSVSLSPEEAEAFAALPGVASVRPVERLSFALDRGPSFVGASQVWSGAAVPGGVGTRGQGTVIGFLDSGVNTGHPSFAPMGAACGYAQPTPKLRKVRSCIFIPDCDESLSGGEDFIGHGSHVAAIGVGNEIGFGSSPAPLFPIAGVAPCAQAITYKVCDNNVCDVDTITSGIEAAIRDEVDILNASLSGGLDPWNDIDRALLAADAVGILAVASAGNFRPPMSSVVGNVLHRGPWVLTVANATHDRINSNSVVFGNGPSFGALRSASIAITADLVAPASDVGNGCNLATGSLEGRIAIVTRSNCPSTPQSQQIEAANALAAVFVETLPALVPPFDTSSTVPAVLLSATDGASLRSALQSSPATSLRIRATAERRDVAAAGNVLNSSSLQGPISLDLTKPDLAAPGTSIYSALQSGPNYGFLTGTSMATPHVAGAAALLRTVHPQWTPAELRSALTLTATPLVREPLGAALATPDLAGSGMLNVAAAVRAGLVMPEVFAAYLAANPASGGQPRRLNLPALRNRSCAGQCSIERRFRNTLAGSSQWNVSVTPPAGVEVEVHPASFTFSGDPAAVQTLVIRARPSGNIGVAVHGVVTLSEASGRSPPLRLPLTIAGSALPGLIFRDGTEGSD
ncbi:MAG: S8 family serine peptidase [Xanthomonadales bacterium]|jgi:subtilisin family serine protease|nr:S8 family serine peptidase [Xanthomonadales bacterium]